MRLLIIGNSSVVIDLILINNSTMASSSFDSTVRIWDLITNTQKFILNGHTNQVVGLKLLSFDILASSSYQEIKLWNTTSGEFIRTLKGHTDNILWSLDLMSDGETLVSGSDDQTIKLVGIKIKSVKYQARFKADINCHHTVMHQVYDFYIFALLFLQLFNVQFLFYIILHLFIWYY